MSLSDTSKILISIKKLVGKAHTSNDKDVANEALPTGITLASNTIFGQGIPVHTGSTILYDVLSNSAGEGAVEFLRLSSSFILGADTSDGRHGFSLQLPDDYETKSKNPKKGTYPFINKQLIYITSGSLQLIPTSFDADYEAKIYHTGSGQTQIAVLDSRDWSLDYFNGIFFQQDPPGTGLQATNPKYVDSYLYIGKYLDEKIISASSDTSGNDNSNANYVFNEYVSKANGTNTYFALDNTPTNSKHVSIYVNGLLQMPATSFTSAPFQDYSITGSNIYFASGSVPSLDSLIMANYTTNTSI
jgi:hypothetical protein